MIRTSLQGTFLKAMTDRRKSWSAADGLGSVLKAPPELSWWYWQEFGTATRGEAHRAAYQIKPVHADQLVFYAPWIGQVVGWSEVQAHPGIYPKRIIRSVESIYLDNLARLTKEAFKNGALSDPSLLRKAVHDAVTFAKQQIVERMAIELPGERPDAEYGRLKGDSAADVFDSRTTVEDF